MKFRMTFVKFRPGGRLERINIWCTKEQLVGAFYEGLAQGYASYSTRGDR